MKHYHLHTPTIAVTAFPTKTEDKLEFISIDVAANTSDEYLDHATTWLVAHPVIPDDATDPTNFTQSYLELCSALINNDHTTYWEGSGMNGGASDLAESCSSIVEDLAKSADMDLTITTNNIVATTKVFPTANDFVDIQVGLVNSTGEVFISKDDVEKLGIDANKKISVSIVSYKFGELITGMGPNKGDKAPVSGVVAITLFVDGLKTSLPVSFTLTIDKNLVNNASDDQEPTCVYQKAVNSGEVTWASDGCKTTPVEDGQIRCHCDHTTNFAILMQVKDVKISSRDEMALSWITKICCTLSIIALIITFGVLIFLRSLLKSDRVTIHLNLVIALILAQVLLLVSEPAAVSEGICRGVAIMLHYFFTAVFCWMLVEGIHLYMMIVQVFSAGKDRLIPYLVVGWGTPFLIVVVTAAIRWHEYGINGNCWLSTTYGMIWAFVGPALFIIVVNFVILIMVLRILIISAKSSSDGDYDHVKAGAKGAILLLPLLGTTWLFGVLSLSAHTVVFLYLFAIFNSLQGVFIFLLYIVFNGEVRNAFNRQQEKRALTNMDSTSMSVSDSKGKSKSSNRVYPDTATKDTQMVDIKSTTTTTTHTQMVIQSSSEPDKRDKPGMSDEPEYDEEDPPNMIADVD